jgi:hypothetical protein
MIIWNVVLSLSVLLFFGCSSLPQVRPIQSVVSPQSVVDKAQSERVPPPAEAVYFSHTVRWPGETFIDMARWYTGAGNNWMRLVEANSSINPKMILIGTSIRIPDELLKTRQPMPRKFISREAADTGRQPLDSEGRTLFGPIETNSAKDKSRPAAGTSRPPSDSAGVTLFGPIESNSDVDASRPAAKTTRRPSVLEEATLFGPIEAIGEKDEPKSSPVYPPLETIK